MQDRTSAGPGLFQAIGIGLVALLVIVAVVVGGWFAGWWLKSANTDRQAEIDRQNYGSQLAYIKKVQSSATDVATINVQIASVTPDQKAALEAQKTAIIAQGCSVASLIVDKPADVATFVAVNC